MVSIRSPRRSEGRYGNSGGNRNRDPVSIRSPRRSEGRWTAILSLPFPHMGFNPLPPPKRGEILPRAVLEPIHSGFNPLPPPKRGEITDNWPSYPTGQVSIRSPRRSEGRFDRSLNVVYQLQVSIRSPPAEARGDHRHHHHFGHHLQFQSAPPAEARGD